MYASLFEPQKRASTTSPNHATDPARIPRRVPHSDRQPPADGSDPPVMPSADPHPIPRRPHPRAVRLFEPPHHQTTTT
jgi:hypothetical protein